MRVDAPNGLNSSRHRCILIQRKMGSRSVVVVLVQKEQLAQVPLAKDDDMVQAFPAERANQPFRMAVLPGGARGNRPVPNAHGPKPADENFAVNSVTIPNDIFGRPVPAAGLGELPGYPFGRRMSRHAKP